MKRLIQNKCYFHEIQANERIVCPLQSSIKGEMPCNLYCAYNRVERHIDGELKIYCKDTIIGSIQGEKT